MMGIDQTQTELFSRYVCVCVCYKKSQCKEANKHKHLCLCELKMFELERKN